MLTFKNYLKHTYGKILNANTYLDGKLICKFYKEGDNKMKIEDLKSLDIVTLRNGDRLLLIDNKFHDLSDDYDNNVVDVFNFNDDLEYEDENEYKFKNDIVKVERPTGYQEIFSRKKESKEMTLKEICDALGYEVKIKKD